MTKPLILQAFEKTEQQVPVWLMRQAGRFLPEYRVIRKSLTLDEMFRNPEIVATVTCLPIDLLKVDAAILFADILTLPMALGFDITFDPERGPVIKNTFQGERDFKHLHALESVPHLTEAIPLINQKLPGHIPLIGFAGAPFTVLCYLVEGGSSTTFRKVIKLAFEYPILFAHLMTFLTDNTIAYLNLQKKAGIKIFQLFDSWGGIFRDKDYEQMILPYVQRIFREVQLPSIYFLKNSCHLLNLVEQAGSDFISIDETVDLKTNPVLGQTKRGIQGNFYHGLLYSDDKTIEREAISLLESAQKFPKYIFNLSHGVQPDVSAEKVKHLVHVVHSFKRSSEK